MITNETYLSAITSQLKSFDIDQRPVQVDIFFLARDWLTTVPSGTYKHVLQALMLRLPQRIYVHQRSDGTTYDVVKGGEIVEALRTFSQQPKVEGQDRKFQRRIEESMIDVVVFRPSMTYEDVKFAMTMLVGPTEV